MLCTRFAALFRAPHAEPSWHWRCDVLAVMMIVLFLFLQKQNLANAIYLFGLGTLLSGLGLKHMRIRLATELNWGCIHDVLLNVDYSG